MIMMLMMEIKIKLIKTMIRMLIIMIIKVLMMLIRNIIIALMMDMITKMMLILHIMRHKNLILFFSFRF